MIDIWYEKTALVSEQQFGDKLQLVVGRHLEITGIENSKLVLPWYVKFLQGKQVVDRV